QRVVVDALARAIARRQPNVAPTLVGRNLIEEKIELAPGQIGDIDTIRRKRSDRNVAQRCADITIDQPIVQKIQEREGDGGDGQGVAHGRPPRCFRYWSNDRDGPLGCGALAGTGARSTMAFTLTRPITTLMTGRASSRGSATRAVLLCTCC